MTANTVNGSGNGARSGAQTLLLLAAPIGVHILRALADGSQRQAELRAATGYPAQTTLRAQLRRLMEINTIERERRNRFPGVLEYKLTPAGRDLLFVLAVLERWLKQAPQGPLEAGGNEARAAVKALAEGWSTTILRALAAGPRSLTELDSIIGALSYPSLERRLGAMRIVGQLEAIAGSSRGTPYVVTDWLRSGIAPLAAASRWERVHLARHTVPIGRLDIEAAFLLAIPLLTVPTKEEASCRLAAEIGSSNGRRLAGAMVSVRQGRIASCTTRLQGNPDAWALGSPAAWLGAVIEGDHTGLELGGDGHLARSLIDGLHESLFRVPSKFD